MIESLILLFTIAVLCLFSIHKPKGKKLKVKTLFRTSNFAISEGEYIFDYQHTNSIRGIAILLIMMGHISGTFHTVILNPIASTGVAIFMILSGFGLSESYKKKGFDSYWKNKIFRLLLPYAFVIIPLLIIWGNTNPIRWIKELTGLATHYWYVAYQMKWYIAFFLVMITMGKNNFMAFSLIAILLFFLPPNLAAEQSFGFVLGILMAQKKDWLMKLSKSKAVWLTIAMFVIGSAFLGVKQIPSVRVYIGK